VLATGRVAIYHLTADGRRFVMETVGPGEAIAAVASLAGGRYPAHAVATADVSAAWLPRESLFTLMDAEPAVSHDIVMQLARRVVHFTGLVQTLSLDVPARLSRFLFERALATGKTTPEGLLVDLGVAKADLAAALGTVPETLSRAFAALKRDGVAESKGRQVLVHDVGALARRSAGYSEE
jgi:CRP/FNR family transcriptional regulator